MAVKAELAMFNSLRPNDAYMRHQTMSSLVQIMACRLLGTKPLSETKLNYCQLHPKEQTSVKLYSKCKYFLSGKRIRKCRLLRCRPFCLGLNVIYKNKSSFHATLLTSSSVLPLTLSLWGDWFRRLEVTIIKPLLLRSWARKPHPWAW